MPQTNISGLERKVGFPGTLVSGENHNLIRGALRQFRNVDSVIIPYGSLIVVTENGGVKLPYIGNSRFIGFAMIDPQLQVSDLSSFPSYAENSGYEPGSIVTVLVRSFYALNPFYSDTFDNEGSFNTVFVEALGNNRGSVSNVAGAGYIEVPNTFWVQNFGFVDRAASIKSGLKEQPIEVSLTISFEGLIIEDNFTINNGFLTDINFSLSDTPTDDVTITISSGNSGVVDVIGSPITITPENFDSGVSLTLDGVTLGSTNISISVASSDDRYNGLIIDDVDIYVFNSLIFTEQLEETLNLQTQNVIFAEQNINSFFTQIVFTEQDESKLNFVTQDIVLTNQNTLFPAPTDLIFNNQDASKINFATQDIIFTEQNTNTIELATQDIVFTEQDETEISNI